MRELFRFPDPVNEVSARLVAGGVFVMAVVALVGRVEWLLPVMAFGFIARVLTGPKISPLALFVTRVLVPRLPLGERPTPGPPKRFAQGMGAVITTAAAVLALGFGSATAAWVLVGLIIAAAALESFFGFCIGCRIFAILMRLGLIPESVCEACADINRRRAAA